MYFVDFYFATPQKFIKILKQIKSLAIEIIFL